MGAVLPLEILLLIATVSPSSWYSLLRACRSLALLAARSSLGDRLKRKFAFRREEHCGWYTALPNGLKHGPFFREYAFVVTVRGEYRDGLLSGEYRVSVGGVPAEVRTYWEGMRHGTTYSYRGDGSLRRKVRYFCDLPLTRRERSSSPED